MAPARNEQTVVNSGFYTTEEAAERLGVSKKTIQSWTLGGKIKCVRTTGNHRRIPKEIVDKIASVNFSHSDKLISSQYKTTKRKFIHGIEAFLDEMSFYESHGKMPKNFARLRNREIEIKRLKEVLESDRFEYFHGDLLKEMGIIQDSSEIVNFVWTKDHLVDLFDTIPFHPYYDNKSLMENDIGRKISDESLHVFVENNTVQFTFKGFYIKNLKDFYPKNYDGPWFFQCFDEPDAGMIFLAWDEENSQSIKSMLSEINETQVSVEDKTPLIVKGDIVLEPRRFTISPTYKIDNVDMWSVFLANFFRIQKIEPFQGS